MKAGFAKQCITPPAGTRMMGIGPRDMDHGSSGVHDNIYVRAAYFMHDAEVALILSYDLCFVGREEADRFKGALGRDLDLLPRQIMLCATHSHVSPSAGSWHSAGYVMPDRLYLEQLERATLMAAREAALGAEECTLWASSGKSVLPMNRRRRVDGQTKNAPNVGGEVCDVLPVCVAKNAQDEIMALLFSVATHPSVVRGFEISAEYCGVACKQLNAALGTAGALFLQGAAGDSKPSTIVDGDNWVWDAGWAEMQNTGEVLAREVQNVLAASLSPVTPAIKSSLTETHWPLQAPPGREAYAAMAVGEGIKAAWARRQLERLDNYGGLPVIAPVLVQYLQLSEDLRFVAIEGEPVARYGNMILKAFPTGTTFPLGYANGEAMYLVTTSMLEEGGMEPESYWEYGHPTPLAPGMESALRDLLGHIAGPGF